MKKVLFATGGMIGVILGVAGWYLWSTGALGETAHVKDVCKVEALEIGNKTGKCHAHAITVRGSAEIDGEATISLLLNGQPYKVARLAGKTEFEWGGDWYSETAEILYQPKDVRSGKVVLRYWIHH